LNNNKLEKLPDHLSNLESLNELRLFNNQLSELPELMGDLEELNILDIMGNQIDSLPESMKWSKNIYLQRFYHDFESQL
jgi:Leucine-rich repeat (LRR) protein